MSKRTTLTFALMDAPFESARTTTAMRMIDVATRRGYDVNIFAYEGAVGLSFAHQKRHANAVHGRDADQEDHPLTREWVVALLEQAAQTGGRLDWVNCGLCCDERGALDHVPGVRRGSPADFWRMASSSDNTLVIATR
ncbi:MAG: FeS-binding protein [Alphaproteobacteria bacterium]|nr:FeS-binding protein [Alphaproteobacteria bacterium]